MGVHDGHRQRVKEQFERQGLDAFTDIQALELLLFYVQPRKDTNVTAHNLIDEFGTIKNVLESEVDELCQVEGVGHETALFLSLVGQMARRKELRAINRNSVLRTATGVVVELLFTAAVAYAMTNKYLRCRNAYYWIFIFTMFFSGGIVPMYLLLRVIGLYDSFWVYIIPSMFSVYNMLIISNFYRGIPYSLYEAAELDGAGELTIWATVYMPLSKPVLATVSLWIAVEHWNSYMGTMLYTEAGEWTLTLQYYLKQLINEASGSSGTEYADEVTAKTVSYAGIIVALIPIMCFYPFIQKHFTKGIMIGSLKG